MSRRSRPNRHTAPTRCQPPTLDVLIGNTVLPKFYDPNEPDVPIVVGVEEEEYGLQMTSCEKLLATARVDGKCVLLSEDNHVPLWPDKPRTLDGFEASFTRTPLEDGTEERSRKYNLFTFCLPIEGEDPGQDMHGWIEVDLYELIEEERTLNQELNRRSTTLRRLLRCLAWCLIY